MSRDPLHSLGVEREGIAEKVNDCRERFRARIPTVFVVFF
jgi:hypothetical protein